MCAVPYELRYSLLSGLLVGLISVSVSSAAEFDLQAAIGKVALIAVFDENDQPLGIGSAFAVDSTGSVVTNYHVVEGASSAILRFPDAEERLAVTGIRSLDPSSDIAVLTVETGTKPIEIGDDVACGVGDRVYAIGNPEGLTGTVSEGIISGFRTIDSNLRLIQITAPISPGSSGGPLLNEAGAVIGIASASLTSGQNLNFAIPITKLSTLSTGDPRLFVSTNLPMRNRQVLHEETEVSDLVRVTNVSGVYQHNNVTITVLNETGRDITDVKVLIVWRDHTTHEPLHHSPVLLKNTFPSMLATTVRKFGANLLGAGLLPHTIKPDARVIDYRILPTSGKLDFE